MCEIVDKIIGRNEICIRCLTYPLFVSNNDNKLKYNAFTPPPNKADVSTLRLKYTDLKSCKQHAKNLDIPSNQYYGLAALKKNHIEQMNSEQVGIEANIVYSPIDSDNNYMDKSIDVYTNTPGIPMHADIVYSQEMKKGEVNTPFRKYAKGLIKLVNFVKDTDPDSKEWTMGHDLLNF